MPPPDPDPAPAPEATSQRPPPPGCGPLRVVVLTTDGYACRGGIALFSRNLVEALAADAAIDRVELLARHLEPGLRDDPAIGCASAPAKLRLQPGAAGGKLAFLGQAFKLLRPGPRLDLLICVHINLLPVAALIALLRGAPLVLVGHGIEVWRRPYRLAGCWLRAVAAVWCVSALSGERLRSWSRLAPERLRVLPNSIALERYGGGPRDPGLLHRYGLPADSRILLTMARLDSRERYKGIDELLDILPKLIAVQPRLHYLVVGEGDDRPRLQARVQALGLAERVRFTGYIREAEKSEHLRLADAFVMAGHGEGFGFVFLEALACGVPAVGSCLDGSREALRDGLLGEIPDPREPEQLQAAIIRALQRPRLVPAGLSYFDWPHFCSRLHTLVRDCLATRRRL